MKTTRTHTLLSVGTLCIAALVSGCGEKPETMLISAKQYLAKSDHKAAIIQIKNALQANPNLPEARFMLGKALFDSGDAVGAETELRKALELKHSREAVLPLLAQALMAQGHPKKVTDEFANVQLTDPTAQAGLQVSLSSAYSELNQTEQAEKLLQATLQTTPDFAPALLEQARRAATRADYAAALALLEQVTAKTPQSMDAWKLKGDIYARMKDRSADAQAAYRKALDIKPDSLSARSALVMDLLHKPDVELAAQELAPLQKLAPNHPNTRYLEALVAYHKKDFKTAATQVQQALNGMPNNLAALQLAGATALQLQQLPQAAAHLSQVVEAAPSMALARRLLVVTYLRMREPVRALDTLQPALQQQPTEPGLAELAGEVYLRNGDLEKADRYFKQARVESPESGRLKTSQVLVKMMRAPANSGLDELQGIAASDSGTTADMALISAHVQRREFEQALKAIAALEKKQPGQPMASYLRARVQLAMNDRPGARKSLEQALTLESGYFAAVASLAALDIAEKKPIDARKRFDALLSKDPKNVSALLALAELAAANGANTNEVAKLIGNAVAANPNDVRARLELVEFYLRKQDNKSAHTAAQSAVAAMPTEPRLLDALGRTQQATGDNNQAQATFHKLVPLMPESPLPYWRLANTQLASKDKEGSIQSLRKALAIKPDFLDGQRALVGLYLGDKRQEEALALAHQVQSQRPKEDIGYLLEADIYSSSKSWDKAVAALRAGQKQAASTQLTINLYALLQAAGKAPEADQVAVQWQKDHPKDAAFVFYLGDRALQRQDLAAAERLYATVLKQQPDNALALNNLAWISGKLKKDIALTYAERAVALAPEQPAFLDTLASLRSDKGDHAKALDLQTRAVAMQPQNPVLKLGLAKIQLRAGKKELAKQSLDELSQLGDAFSGQAELAALRKEAAQP